MLNIEKGGEAQAREEIDAYNPLIPKGRDLVITLMFEIENREQRMKILKQLGHVEDTIELQFSIHTVKAEPASPNDPDRTTADGKTSAVHFLRFTLSPEQATAFKQLNPDSTDGVHIRVKHSGYPHSVTLSAPLVRSLQVDFA
jgi:hypothetical protein